MGVQKHDFEGCCTADILTNFGQSHTSEYGHSRVTYAKLRQEVINKVDGVKHRHGIITAILTSEQTTAAKVLKDLGFTGTGMASKNAHSEVDIELYYLHCKDWEAPELPEEEKAQVAAPVAAPQPFAAARNPVPQPNRVQRARDAQGRFVGNQAVDQNQRGVVFFVSHYNGRRRYAMSVNRDNSINYVNLTAHAKIFTRDEFNSLVQWRRDLGYKELTFQPI